MNEKLNPDGTPKDATPPASSPDNDSGLKPEQIQAELDRKTQEIDGLKQMIEDKDGKLEDLMAEVEGIKQATAKGDNAKKVTADAATLAKQLRQQAANGDIHAIAVLEAAREVAREEYGQASLKERMDASFDQMESFQTSKAKEHKMSVKEFRDAIDAHAEPYKHKLPHVQMQLAYSSWAKEQSLSTREQRIIAEEKKLGLWQDPGTEGSAPDAGSTTKAEKKTWKDDKTRDQKLSSLGSL